MFHILLLSLSLFYIISQKNNLNGWFAIQQALEKWLRFTNCQRSESNTRTSAIDLIKGGSLPVALIPASEFELSKSTSADGLHEIVIRQTLYPRSCYDQLHLQLRLWIWLLGHSDDNVSGSGTLRSLSFN
jgi:hypothetical protein